MLALALPASDALAQPRWSLAQELTLQGPILSLHHGTPDPKGPDVTLDLWLGASLVADRPLPTREPSGATWAPGLSVGFSADVPLLDHAVRFRGGVGFDLAGPLDLGPWMLADLDRDERVLASFALLGTGAEIETQMLFGLSDRVDLSAGWRLRGHAVLSAARTSFDTVPLAVLGPALGVQFAL